MAKEKKGRKFGRHERNPSSKMYTVAKRWVTNKARKMKRHTRRMAKKALHRIEWEISRRPGHHPTGSEAERMQQLRHVISQNHTG